MASMSKACCSGPGPGHEHGHDHAHQHDHGPGHASHAHPPATAIDPVCGMTVKIEGAKHVTEHAGQRYYFCNPKCLAKFTAEPARYLQPKKEEPAPDLPAGTIYTCPMHPEVRRVGPGSCPICGMALEPELVTAEAPPNHE